MERESAILPQAIAAGNVKGLFKIVKPYNGTGDICKWLDKFKTVMKLQKLTGNTCEYIPYFLEGDAYELYSQLDEEVLKSGEKLEKSLKKCFGIDSFEAFELLRNKRWDGTESVDVYLASIQRLASLCDIKSQEFVIHSFITGMPDDTATTLRTQIQVSQRSLAEIVETTRVLLKDKRVDTTLMLKAHPSSFRTSSGRNDHQLRCNRCFEVGHTIRFCRSSEDKRRCYRCNQIGHIAPQCRFNHSGNAIGESRAPAASQEKY